jgi:hypothetical protein
MEVIRSGLVWAVYKIKVGFGSDQSSLCIIRSEINLGSNRTRLCMRWKLGLQSGPTVSDSISEACDRFSESDHCFEMLIKMNDLDENLDLNVYGADRRGVMLWL